MTSSDRPLAWNNSMRLAGDPVEAVARPKASEGPNLLIQGSGMLYEALLPAGVVDRLALITLPIMLGRGKRWYSGDPTTARSRALIEQAHSPGSVHFASSARGGEVRSGSFTTEPQGADELALRQRRAEPRWSPRRSGRRRSYADVGCALSAARKGGSRTTSGQTRSAASRPERLLDAVQTMAREL